MIEDSSFKLALNGDYEGILGSGEVNVDLEVPDECLNDGIRINGYGDTNLPKIKRNGGHPSKPAQCAHRVYTVDIVEGKSLVSLKRGLK